jgi:hypothetical protein
MRGGSVKRSLEVLSLVEGLYRRRLPAAFFVKNCLILWAIIGSSAFDIALAQTEGIKLSGSLGNEVAYGCKSWSDCRKSGSLLNPDGIFDSDIREIEDTIRLNINADAQVAEKAKVAIRSEYSFVPTDPSKTHRVTLDEAFLDIELAEYLFLKTGKQRIAWGTGFAWNPADVINPPKNPQDPRRQKEGITSVKALYSVGFLSVTGVLVPDVPASDPRTGEVTPPKIENIAAAGRMAALLFDFDWSLIFRAAKDRRAVFGADFSGILFGEAEIHGEAAARQGSDRYYIKGGRFELRPDFKPDDLFQPAQTKVGSKDVFPKFVLGGNYTAPTDTFILVEYYYNGEGYTKDEFSKYIEYLRYYADGYEKDKSKIPLGFLPQGLRIPEKEEMLKYGLALFTPGNLRRNYLFLNLTHPIEEIVSLSARALWGIDDLIDSGYVSVMVSPSIDYVEINNVTFSLGGNIFIGNKETEFGMVPNAFNITAGLTMYF